MEEAPVRELEAAIADVGTLLVRVRKYRAGAEDRPLLREALSLGDVARRHHRRGTLDEHVARGLVAEARGLADRLRAHLDAIRAAPGYVAAVMAHAAGDQAALARLLPSIFAGLEPAPAPVDLFHAVPWTRRGRRRPVAEVVAAVRAARDEGLVAEGDDLSPGADPALPAVVLAAAPPPDEPVSLRLGAGAIPAPVYRLRDTGEHLVYAPRLRAPAVVRLAVASGEPEDATAALDYERYRWELAAALGAAGLQVEDEDR